MKRILSLVCALVLVLAMIPLTARAAESTLKAEIHQAVDSQIRAFAATLKQSGSDDTAAKALAKHGLTQGGKKLSAGKSHSLTAALWSTELLPAALIDGCSEALSLMQATDPTDPWYVRGDNRWNGAASIISMTRISSPELKTMGIDFTLAQHDPYTGPRNSYDSSMDWMVSGFNILLEINWVKTTASALEYKVTCRVSDRFDFSTSGSGAFKNLISGIGAILFREFDWESTVTFNLSVPYACSHKTAAYSWSYDTSARKFQNITAGEFSPNPTVRHQTSTTEAAYCHELEQAVVLQANRPWVLEYDTRNPKAANLSPFRRNSDNTPLLRLGARTYVAIMDQDVVQIPQADREQYGIDGTLGREGRYYGAYFHNAFPYSALKTYTFRLENLLDPAGGNMICLSILEPDTGEILMDRLPLDTLFVYPFWSGATGINPGNSKPGDWSDAGNWISGRDFYISFLGNQAQPFVQDQFDLRIWENGKEVPTASACTEKVTQPTCTARGYTTYTCTHCGYACKGSYTNPIDHRWSEWAALSPTLYERKCTGCGEAEQETRLLPGDANGDGTVNTLDLIVLRQYLASWDVTIHAADCNGDGTINALDLVRLRQYLAGWEAALEG